MVYTRILRLGSVKQFVSKPDLKLLVLERTVSVMLQEARLLRCELTAITAWRQVGANLLRNRLRQAVGHYQAPVLLE